MIKNCLGGLALVAALGCGGGRSGTPPGYQGVVEFEETTLGFETGGRIERLLVQKGDRVARGARIAELDDRFVRAARSARVLEAEVAHAQAKLVGAGARAEDVSALAARVRAARASEDLLAKNLTRQRALFEKSVVPEASVDELEGQLARARAERESTEAELSGLRRGARPEERHTALAHAEAVEAALALENDRLARHLLDSPIDGRVLDRHVEVGEVVASGAPVVTLANPRRPYAEVFVAQTELAGIDVGDSARLRVDAEASFFSGTVEHIASHTEFTPRYIFSERERPNLVVRVRVRVDDSKERLHAGVPAFVEIQRTSAEESK